MVFSGTPLLASSNDAQSRQNGLANTHTHSNFPPQNRGISTLPTEKQTLENYRSYDECRRKQSSLKTNGSRKENSVRASTRVWVPRCASSTQVLLLFLSPLLLMLFPDLGEASICIDRFQCETGEEKRVVKCVDAAIDLVPMCLSPALLQLSLHSTKIHALYLVSLRFYTDLRHVNLSDNEINYIEAKSFECQPNLEELHLAHNKLTSLDPDTFLGLHNLTVLSLQGNLLDEIPDRTFEHLRRLEMLDLSHNRLHSIGDSALQPLSVLRVLQLSNNMLQGVPAAALEHVPNLAELSLGTNSFSALRAEDLAPLSFLTSLDLSGAPLQDGLHAQSFSALKDLRLLRLDDCGLKSVPTEALGVLERLENLYLNRNEFVELGPQILDNNRRLQIIEIMGCPELERISSDAFKSNLDLRRVIIARNPKLWIIPAGTFRFLTQMTYLDLHANNLRTLQREVAVWNDIPIWLLHDNPLECNCSIAWLREQLDINSSKPAVLCSTPPRLGGRALATTEVADVSCGIGPATQGLMIGIIVVVSLAICIAVIVVLLFRHRRPLFREMFKRPEWNGRTEWNGRCAGSTCSRDLRAYPHDYPEYIMAAHKPVPVTEL
ncbi:Leucine-rich repeat [Trinorchestia longiramus]|nr:Leucine-rich repeat [Trinorchestia longiramus]